MKVGKRVQSITQRISLWGSLKALAVVALVSVFFSVAVEAQNLREAFFVWVKERILKLTWEAPAAGGDHYRLEISKTTLLEEPVTTYLSYAYAKDPSAEVELEDDCSYGFRVQSVSPYGVLSAYSDSSGLFAYRGLQAPLGGASVASPVEFSLSQNYPNPFNSRTNIEYQVTGGASSGQEVSLAVYNVLGQRVRVLVDDLRPPGRYLVVWDGRDDRGREVAAGHYVYQVTAGRFQAAKKMIYLK